MAGRSTDRPGDSVRPQPRRRGWLEVRWRQFRNAPRPVVRAVVSPLAVAVVLAAAYLAYDVALSHGASLPGGDLRVLAGAVYVFAVVAVGALVTWLVVPLPTGAGSRATRTPWSAALGLFAAVPIAYLVLVVALELVRPLIG
ncbi:MAG TPA: hypothetical protein VFK54_08220 [Candidatus Limnocylindrales bacterium]|nr:hypothetical protein [Candidatus Limnocylindrales bacterium]